MHSLNLVVIILNFKIFKSINILNKLKNFHFKRKKILIKSIEMVLLEKVYQFISLHLILRFN